MTAAARPDVSVVLPTKNAGPRLADVLEAVRNQDTGRQVEIVAFDSGSTDGTVRLLQEHGARVTEIPPSEFNHGETRNHAIASSRGRLVVLLTQDALPANRQWMEALLSPFDDDNVAGTYARQIPLPDADALTRRNLESWVTGSDQRRVQQLPDRASYLRLHPLERYKLCCFDDVCSAIRRDAWERIPYEWAYFAEDLDWGKKALEAGWSLVYEPRAAVVHSHDRSVWYEYKRTYLCHRRLYELFGLRSVPTLRDALRNSARGGLADAAYAWRRQPGWRRRTGLALRAPLLALLSNLAQWRGAADERLNRPVPLMRGV
jgi:rhamnosyltransferase